MLLEFILLLHTICSNVGRSQKVFLTSRIWQKWRDVISLAMLPRLSSIFLGDSLGRIIILLVLMKQVAVIGRLTWRGTELPVNIQLRTEALYPTAQKKGNHLTNHVSELGRRSCFSQDFKWNPGPGQYLHERPWGREPAKPCLDSWPTETVRCLF